MNVENVVVEQGSLEWLEARLGMPTASHFDEVLTKAKKVGEISKTRRTYCLKLAGEIITGEVADIFQNRHMERGQFMENEARQLYEMVLDVETERVGFLKGPTAGASPDSLVGDDGLLEIKTKLPHLQIETLLAGDLPEEHKAQCQGQLWVAQREWLDFVSYWPGMPLFMVRLQRDEVFIKNLEQQIDLFCAERDELVAKVRSYKAKAAA